MTPGARRARWMSAAAIVLLAVAMRVPALTHPRPIDDEAIYSVVGATIVDGGRPYRDAIERKPPLLFWTYAAIFDAAGTFNWHALHLVALLWTLLTMAGLYELARRLFDWRAGLIAALLYAVFQPWLTWKDLALNGEMMMNLPIVWAWAIGLNAGGPPLLLSGALLAAAFLLKQPAALAAVPLGVYLLLPSYRREHGFTIRDSLVHASLLTAGFAAVLGLVAAILARQGILADAYYWTIADHDVPHVFWRHAGEHTAAFLLACLPLVAGAFVSLRDDGPWAGRRAERLALAGLTVVSAIGVVASGRFYPHYYIQLVPPLALLAAPLYARLWPLARPPADARSRWGAAALAWTAAAAVGFTAASWYALEPRRVPSAAAEYVREHSSPRDRLLVWGQSPDVYTDAERLPATRYVTTFALTGYLFGDPVPGIDTRARIVRGAWSHFEADVAAHPPRFIVDPPQSDPRYAMTGFPFMRELVASRYRLEIVAGGCAVYRRIESALPETQ